MARDLSQRHCTEHATEVASLFPPEAGRSALGTGLGTAWVRGGWPAALGCGRRATTATPTARLSFRHATGPGDSGAILRRAGAGRRRFGRGQRAVEQARATAVGAAAGLGRFDAGRLVCRLSSFDG